MKEKNENTGISVVLPVHELNDTTKPMFDNAIKSLQTQKVLPDEIIIVVPAKSEVLEYLTQYNFDTIKDIVSILENSGETDFASQVNLGVANAKSEWVSFLEFDDEYANIWFKSVVDVNDKGEFIGFTNEAVWATSFSDELGFLDLNALLTYQNFNIDGIVIKKSIYEDYGGFKASIKLTFIYEFLLRMTYKDVKVMVIPKFGYKHVNQRPDSLFAIYKETIDPVEAKWWLSQAKKEYYFDTDRKITYETQIS